MQTDKAIKQIERINNDLKSLEQIYYQITLSYCLKCGVNTESQNTKVTKTCNGKILFSSKCAVWSSK